MIATNAAFATTAAVQSADEWDEFLFTDDQPQTSLDAKGLAALGSSLMISALVLGGALCMLMSLPAIM